MADYQTDSPTDPQTHTRVHAHEQFQAQFQDQLSEEYTIETPENVSFGYEVAGIGSRFIASLIDNIILGVLLVGLNIAILVLVATFAGDTSSIDQSLEQTEENWVVGIIIAIYALLNFAIWWGYYCSLNGSGMGRPLANAQSTSVWYGWMARRLALCLWPYATLCASLTFYQWPMVRV